MTSRCLVLLSGERTEVPEAEARAIFLTYDPGAEFSSPEPRVLMAKSNADPFVVGSRAAYIRRVGLLFGDIEGALVFVGQKRTRFRSFDLADGLKPADPDEYLLRPNLRINLERPELELTVVRGRKEYICVTDPASMNQGWSRRRPRSRAFFHPSAIFPKLSRALVNLSRCKAGGIFLDPFSGTGSITIEAHLVGARVVALDLSEKMVRGSLSNMRLFEQEWLGVARADAFQPPLRLADAIATDIPYGRASSTAGIPKEEVLTRCLKSLPEVMRKGSRLVMMHPKQLKVDSSPEFALEEELDLYVHKLLTRTISVLRRR